MKRRFLLILLAATLFCNLAYAQDNVLRCGFKIHQENNEHEIDFRAVYTDGKICLLTDFFPDSYISVPYSYPGNASERTKREKRFRHFTLPDASAFAARLRLSMQYEEKKGIFSGDLFDHASFLQSGTVTLSDVLTAFICSMDLPSGCEPGSMAGSMNTALSGILRIFDRDSFFSFTALSEGNTIMTVSADMTDKNRLHVIAGYPESGKNYFIDAEMDVISDTEAALLVKFFPDTNRGGYRSIEKEKPILCISASLRISEGYSRLDYDGTVTPGNELNEILFKGTVEPDSRQPAYTEIRFRDYEKAYYSFSAEYDDEAYDLSKMKETPLLTDKFMTEAAGSADILLRISQLYTGFAMSLPESYLQKIMMIQ